MSMPSSGDHNGGDVKEEKSGVVVTHKEMYHSLMEVIKTLQRMETRMESRMDVLESKVEASIQADERSRDAIAMAQEALKIARKIDKRHDWLAWTVVIGGLIAGALGLLFYFAQMGMGG